MKNKPENRQEPVSGTDSDVLKGIYRAEHRPTHDQKWAELDSSDAAFARAALGRAEEIRAEGLDPGDAYLQGVADLHAAKARQRLIDSIDDFDFGTLAPPPS